MKTLQDRHRRWLDRQMPSAHEAQLEFRALYERIEGGKPRPRRWPGLVVAMAAAAAAVVVLGRGPEPAPPVPWDVRFALHVAGQPEHADVAIRIALRKDD